MSEARTRPRGDKAEDTRRRMIEAATRHFAQFGFEGASQRAIQREVGVNPATSHYHFGSKEALYQAVVETFLAQIQRERIEALEALSDRSPPNEKLTQLLRGYLGPHIRLAATEQGFNYARILAAIQYKKPDAATAIFDAAVTPVRDRYLEVLQGLFPEAEPRDVAEALSMAVVLMATAPIRMRRRSIPPADIPRVIEGVVGFASAGFLTTLGPISE